MDANAPAFPRQHGDAGAPKRRLGLRDEVHSPKSRRSLGDESPKAGRSLPSRQPRHAPPSPPRFFTPLDGAAAEEHARSVLSSVAAAVLAESPPHEDRYAYPALHEPEAGYYDPRYGYAQSAPYEAETYDLPPYEAEDPSYKTRLCVFPGGECPHGARCKFAHGQAELRPPPATATESYKTRPCRYTLADCPFAAAGRCQFAHSLDELRHGPPHLASDTQSFLTARRFKTKMCKYGEACPYQESERCQFAHTRDELRPHPHAPPRKSPTRDPSDLLENATAPQAWPPRTPPRAERAVVDPTTFAMARLARVGAEADLSRKRFTEICKYFVAGHCPFEVEGKCQFAHSTRELRTFKRGGGIRLPGHTGDRSSSPFKRDVKKQPPATPPTPVSESDGSWQEAALQRAFPVPDIDVPGGGWALDECDPNVGTHDPFVVAADEYAAQYAADVTD